MKLKNIFISLMTVTLSLYSCSDWFDVTSSTTVKGTEIFKSEQGFKDVFTGIYSLLTTDTLYGKDLSYGYNDVRAKYWNITKNSHIYYKAINYDYTSVDQVDKIDAFWNYLYKAISNVNSILANIDNNKSVFSSGMYDLYKGEAYALRAMLHFEVLRLYGASPASVGAMESKSIPYYDQLTNVAQPVLSMGDVLNKIREDISKARALMMNDPYGPNYAAYTEKQHKEMRRDRKMNYWATIALLARVELYAGNKEVALRAAKEIVGEAGSLPKAPFAVNSGSADSKRLFDTELIFALNIKTLEEKIDPQFGEKGALTSSSTGLLMRSTDYNNIFKLGSSDLEYRKQLWYKSADAGNFTLLKFKSVTAMPMFRLSELYYIAAEATTDQVTALTYLNTIRAGRGLVSLSSNAVVANEIKTEYLREFVGEGQAFYYFKRLGLTKIGIANKAITLNQYVLPYPTLEVEFGKI